MEPATPFDRPTDGPADPELVIGLVSPIGSTAGEVVQRLRAELRERCGYDVEIIKLSSHLPSQAPEGEFEDQRVERLIAAGNSLCEENTDPAAVGRLAIFQISFARERLDRLRTGSVARYAYVIDSLKRPAEVGLLRAVYGPQFVLVGFQDPRSERFELLLKANLSATNELEKRKIAQRLLILDADEGAHYGQKVNDTFAQADYFLGADEPPARLMRLLFGDRTIAPEFREYAMYLAYATSARSLSPGRKVGAVLATDESVISTAIAEHRAGLLTYTVGEPASPVQLMGLYQTKGREADATIVVLRSNDFYGTERYEPFDTGSRLLYVVLSRARHKTVVLLFGDDPRPLVAPLVKLAS